MGLLVAEEKGTSGPRWLQAPTVILVFLPQLLYSCLNKPHPFTPAQRLARHVASLSPLVRPGLQLEWVGGGLF